MAILVRIYGQSFSRLEIFERHCGAAESIVGLVQHRAAHCLSGGALLLRGKTWNVEQADDSYYAAQDTNAPTGPLSRKAARQDPE
jgi:hypothetical protein